MPSLNAFSPDTVGDSTNLALAYAVGVCHRSLRLSRTSAGSDSQYVGGRELWRRCATAPLCPHIGGVVGLSPKEQVARIDTRRCIAAVKNVEAIYPANELAVGNARGYFGLPRRRSHRPIAVNVQGGRPEPTPRIWVAFDAGHKPLFDRQPSQDAFKWLIHWITVTSTPVVALAKTLGGYGSFTVRVAALRAHANHYTEIMGGCHAPF